MDAQGKPLRVGQVVRVAAGGARHLGVVSGFDRSLVLVRWGATLRRTTRYRGGQLVILELRELSSSPAEPPDAE